MKNSQHKLLQNQHPLAVEEDVMVSPIYHQLPTQTNIMLMMNSTHNEQIKCSDHFIFFYLAEYNSLKWNKFDYNIWVIVLSLKMSVVMSFLVKLDLCTDQGQSVLELNVTYFHRWTLFHGLYNQ